MYLHCFHYLIKSDVKILPLSLIVLSIYFCHSATKPT